MQIEAIGRPVGWRPCLLGSVHKAVRAVAFAKTANSRYWLQGYPTSDAAVVVDAAVSIGYDRNAVRVGMQKAETKDRLVFETEEEIRRGVSGSPFFIVDGEPFWGSDRISLMLDHPRQDT